MDLNLLIEEEVLEESSVDSANEGDAFAEIERSYNKLILEMCDDPAMSKYADEYAALFDFTYSVHIKSLNLANTKDELEAEYEETEKRLLKTSQMLIEDLNVITSLKSEVQNSHKMLDTAHEREQAAMEVIDNLRHTVDTLQGEIDFKNKMSEVDNTENPTVAKHRQGLERERVILLSEVTKMNEKFEAALEYQEELEQRTDQTDVQIHEIIGKLDEANLELTKVRRVKERMEQDVTDLVEDIEAHSADIVDMTANVNVDQRAVVKLDADLKEQTVASAKCYNEVMIWNQRYCKMQDELNRLNYAATTEKLENDKMNKSLRFQDHEQDLIKKDIETRSMQKETAERKKRQLAGEMQSQNKERNKVREDIAKSEVMIITQKLLNDTTKRHIVDKVREKDMINRNLTRQHAVSSETIQHIALQQGQIKQMEMKIENQVEHQNEQRKHMGFLERERDRLVEDAAEKARQIDDLMDDVKTQKVQIFDRKKKLADSQNRLRMQQNLYEACRADKTTLEKSLKENIAHAADLKHKVYEFTRSNELMKNEIFYKEQECQAKAKHNKAMELEKGTMQLELDHNLKEIRELREAVAYHKVFTKDLLTQIEQADIKLREDDKTIVTFVNERDLLSAQLVRRNEELALLYKKMLLLKTVLEYGRAQYGRRLEDLTLLKREILRIRQSKSLFEKKISNMNDFKAEVLALEKDLTRERIKCKMLKEEMRNPMNIHRWSKLEGSDPDMFNLMRKILLLQKKVLRHSETIHAREVQLKEMNILYKTMRKMVSKQLGPNIHARMKNARNNVRESNTHSRLLAVEMKVTEDDVHHCNLRLQNVSIELRKERQKLLHEKKLRQKNMEKLRHVQKQGQDIMDNMATLLSDKTVLDIAIATSDAFLM